MVHGMSPIRQIYCTILADWTSLKGESNLPKRVEPTIN